MRISDWSSDVCSSDLRVKPNSAKAKTVSAAPPPPPTVRKKLSYKDQRDYDMLPGRIEAIETEMAELESDLSDGGLFTRDHARFTALTGHLDKLRAEKAAAEARTYEARRLGQQCVRPYTLRLSPHHIKK